MYTNGYDSSNRWSIGTNGTIGTNTKTCHSNGSISEYASYKGDLIYFPMWPGWVQGNSNGPLVPIEKDVIPIVLLVNMLLIKETSIIFPCDLAGHRAIPLVRMVRLVPTEKDVISNGSIGE